MEYWGLQLSPEIQKINLLLGLQSECDSIASKLLPSCFSERDFYIGFSLNSLLFYYLQSLTCSIALQTPSILQSKDSLFLFILLEEPEVLTEEEEKEFGVEERISLWARNRQTCLLQVFEVEVGHHEMVFEKNLVAISLVRWVWEMVELVQITWEEVGQWVAFIILPNRHHLSHKRQAFLS